MQTLLDALVGSLDMLVSLDPRLFQIIGLTLRVTLTSLLISCVIGLPIGAALGLTQRMPAPGLFVALLYTGMGLPPVVVGLLVFVLLSRAGPLGALGWLFTPSAMISAQSIIAVPMVVGLTMSAVSSVDPALRMQLHCLGATRVQTIITMLVEAKLGVLAAIAAAYGRIVAEVGAVMLVGGNIEGNTRVLTSAIVLETRKGSFALALALGFVLLAITFLANGALLRFGGWYSRIR